MFMSTQEPKQESALLVGDFKDNIGSGSTSERCNNLTFFTIF